MKIRNGFISNSSSTSFVLFGEKVSYNSVMEDKEYIKGINNDYTYIYFTYDFTEGRDVIIMTPQIIDKFKEMPKENIKTLKRLNDIYKAYYYNNSESWSYGDSYQDQLDFKLLSELKIKHPDSSFLIIKCDMHGTYDNIETFKTLYIKSKVEPLIWRF